MPERVHRGFPLFPLGIVALPSEHVPLHIFEDRYRRMIEQCLTGELGSLQREFGIVWLSDEELKDVGCACEVERVLERMDDGRMNILARGTRPFRLLERQDELPYPAGVVEFLDDEADASDVASELNAPEPADDETTSIETTADVDGAEDDAAARARELYRELVEQATDRQLSDDELAAMDAYEMAATVEFSINAKQQLLELRSEDARLRLLALLLRTALDRLELIDRAQTRAASNGKVRFG
ncbi:MAG TPA: LON peptidase substrate-binding domain-containing protein [Solirubrobacteraceae bacterium]|jgi:Lon protease-like protein|nr:LON peptidase substrate-binding domain-containing protein [Solirubrobacteraceae bacterium]